MPEKYDAEVSRLYSSGVSIKSLSEKFNVKETSIETSLKHSGTPKRITSSNKHTNHVKMNINSVYQEYLSQKSLKSVSLKYKVSREFLSNAFKENGLGVCPKNSAKKLSNENYIIELYEYGLKINEISTITGDSVWNIGKHLREVGIDTRGRLKSKDKSEYQKYKDTIRYLTKRNYIKHKNEINPENKRIGKTEYHIDHMYSIFEGFRNNVKPEIVSHEKNLEVLHYTVNTSKGLNSSQSLDELLEKIVFNRPL